MRKIVLSLMEAAIQVPFEVLVGEVAIVVDEYSTADNQTNCDQKKDACRDLTADGIGFGERMNSKSDSGH